MQEDRSWVRRLVDGALAPFSLDARPLIMSFSICSGAAIYFALPAEPSRTAVCALVGASLLLWLAARRWLTSDIAITVVAAAFGMCLGIAAGSFRSAVSAAPVIVHDTGPVMLEGWVQDVEPGKKGARLLIRVHAIGGMTSDATPRFVRLTHGDQLEVSPGRFVRCWSVLRPPPGPSMPLEYDFRRQAWFEQLGAVGYVQGRCRGGVLGAPAGIQSEFAVWLGAVRRNLALAVNDAAGERAGGFAAALVTGDRSLIPTEDDEALRDTGLTHILSISGVHLTIVGGLVFFFVKRVLSVIEPIALRIAVQKPAAITALFACFAYMVLSGSSVPAQRAFIMAAIVFGAIIADRAPISLRTFAIALMVIVLLQPESVVTPGFQMSFAATGALVTIYEIWRNQRSGKEHVLGPVSTSLLSVVFTSVAAGLATMPFILFHFDRATPIGFVANLFATPIISFLSAPSAALALLLTPFGLSDIGLRLFGLSLELVLAVAHFFAQYSAEPGASDRPMPVTAMLLASIAVGAFMTTSHWMRLISSGLFVALALISWSVAPKLVAHWSASGVLFIPQQDGRIVGVPLLRGDGLPPMRFGEAVTRPCTDTLCSFALPDGFLAVVQVAQTPKLCLTTFSEEHAGSACQDHAGGQYLVTDWHTVQAANGWTVYRVGSQMFVTNPPACGARPWHPCIDESGPA